MIRKPKKPINRKHKYSTWALLFLIFLLIVGGVVALDSRELDILCADNNSLLKRIDGLWQCYNESVSVSDLADYVPYTGATQSLNLGANTFRLGPINIDNGIGTNTVGNINNVAVGLLNSLPSSFNYALGYYNSMRPQNVGALGFLNFGYEDGASLSNGQMFFGIGNYMKVNGGYSYGENNRGGMDSNSSNGVILMGKGNNGDGRNIFLIGISNTGGQNNSKNIILLGDSMTSYVNNTIEMGFEGQEYIRITNESVFVPNSLAVGSAYNNTNLTDGGIRADTLYVHQITYESPEIICKGGTNWCKAEDIEYREPLYFQHDGEWNVLRIIHNEIEYTPQQFNQDVCNRNERLRNTCDELIKQLQFFKEKQEHDRLKRECEGQGDYYFYLNGLCLYEEALACEATGYSVFIDGQCYENPFYKCQQTANSVWNYEANTCDLVIIEPQPTQEMTPEICYTDKSKVWNGTHCVGVDE